MSAPFLSPRGEGSRWTICTACSASARVEVSCRPQFAYAIFVTISPRSFRASSTAATSNSRCSVDFTPISILSKSINTAILNFSSISCLLIFLTVKLGTRLYPVSSRRHARPDEAHDFLERSPRLEYRRHTLAFKLRGVFIRNNAADHHPYIRHVFFTQQLHHARHNGVMGSGKNRQADD